MHRANRYRHRLCTVSVVFLFERGTALIGQSGAAHEQQRAKGAHHPDPTADQPVCETHLYLNRIQLPLWRVADLTAGTSRPEFPAHHKQFNDRPARVLSGKNPDSQKKMR
jgi:hypothetical protein